MHAFEKELTVAMGAARDAGARIMSSYAQLSDGDVSEKAANDMVTVVDHASQKIVVDAIRAAFPDDFIVAEEHLSDSVNAGRDPEGSRLRASRRCGSDSDVSVMSRSPSPG